MWKYKTADKEESENADSPSPARKTGGQGSQYFCCPARRNLCKHLYQYRYLQVTGRDRRSCCGTAPVLANKQGLKFLL